MSEYEIKNLPLLPPVLHDPKINSLSGMVSVYLKCCCVLYLVFIVLTRQTQYSLLPAACISCIPWWTTTDGGGWENWVYRAQDGPDSLHQGWNTGQEIMDIHRNGWGCFSKHDELSDRAADCHPIHSVQSRMVRCPVRGSVLLIETAPLALSTDEG